MKPEKIWANFSVKDVKRTHEFYSSLGFTANPTNDHPQLASFVFGENNFVIHFFEEGSQIDEYLAVGPKGEIIFTLSAENDAKVKAWAEEVRKAGGTFFKEPGSDDNGYYGFGFADPDGHRFNVLSMEGM